MGECEPGTAKGPAFCAAGSCYCYWNSGGGSIRAHSFLGPPTDHTAPLLPRASYSCCRSATCPQAQRQKQQLSPPHRRKARWYFLPCCPGSRRGWWTIPAAAEGLHDLTRSHWLHQGLEDIGILLGALQGNPSGPSAGSCPTHEEQLHQCPQAGRWWKLVTEI